MASGLLCAEHRQQEARPGGHQVCIRRRHRFCEAVACYGDGVHVASWRGSVNYYSCEYSPGAKPCLILANYSNVIAVVADRDFLQSSGRSLSTQSQCVGFYRKANPQFGLTRISFSRAPEDPRQTHRPGLKSRRRQRCYCVGLLATHRQYDEQSCARPTEVPYDFVEIGSAPALVGQPDVGGSDLCRFRHHPRVLYRRRNIMRDRATEHEHACLHDAAVGAARRRLRGIRIRSLRMQTERS